MTPLEVAAGAIWGKDPEVAAFPAAPTGLTARDVLEDVVRRALHRQPCVVSFSGGRDSSAVLALAVHVARRDGLPLPVPVTFRFPGCESSWEDEWQDAVIRHLGLTEWTHLVLTDELDILGDYALRVLGEHGLLWPANAHAHLPIAEQAAGGTVLTGVGGDEVLTSNALCVRTNRVLLRQVRPQPRDVLRIGAFHGPRVVRRMAMRRRLAAAPSRPWLRPDAAEAVISNYVNDHVAEPLRWDRSLDRGWWRSRYRSHVQDSLRRVAAMGGAEIAHPLTDPVFLAAFGAECGRLGPVSRTDAMRRLFGDLLPTQLIERPGKASMGGVFWTDRAERFAAEWSGAGVDTSLVQTDVLKKIWTDPHVYRDFRTFAMFHCAWLAESGGKGA